MVEFVGRAGTGLTQNDKMQKILGTESLDLSKEYPNVNAWVERVNERERERESVKKIKAARDQVLASQFGSKAPATGRGEMKV